jgi:tight adherence protein C
MTVQVWGALTGLAAAAGVLLVASWIRARRPARVGPRIAPFVPSLVGGAHSAMPRASFWATLRLLVVPARGDRSRGASAADTERADTQLHLLAGVALGGALGGVLGVVVGKGSPSPGGVLLLGFIGAVTGYLAGDRYRAQLVRRRRTRIDQQLPTIVELLAFAVAAGESPLSALDRVARTSPGDLCDEVRICVSEVRSGVMVEGALRSMSDRVASARLSRFIDTLLVALDRGTPLAEVMRAQAADCRADERRHLLEVAGRKDVLMLVPVVFLILPTVVLVALYPGVQSLRMVVA